MRDPANNLDEKLSWLTFGRNTPESAHVAGNESYDYPHNFRAASDADRKLCVNR
jgi:hypothetical protein